MPSGHFALNGAAYSTLTHGSRTSIEFLSMMAVLNKTPTIMYVNFLDRNLGKP